MRATAENPRVASLMGVNPNFVIAATFAIGAALAALAGVGIGQSYNYAVAHHLEEGRLVPVLDDWSWSGPPLGAVHLPNRFLSPKVQVFLDFVKESLGTKVSPYRADWDNR